MEHVVNHLRKKNRNFRRNVSDVHIIKGKGIFKRIEKEEDKQIVVDSYCTRPYVQDVILRYCQNRSIFKTKFAIIDGMLLE